MKKQDEFVSSILGYPEKDISEGEPDDSGGPKEIWTLDLPVISRALQPG
jgi:hypothetical protein